MQCLWFKYDLRNAEIQYGQHCDVYTVVYKLMCEFYKFKCKLYRFECKLYRFK